jgi:galactokinase
MYFDGKATAIEIAQIGQIAENKYFGKPCGLMDQMASSVGNLVTIDFADNDHPIVEKIDFNFETCGYTLCIIDSGADHADLTDEYAAITGELGKVCGLFGKRWLREVPEEDFMGRISEVRTVAGDRAVLRALHVYEENRRVEKQCEALKKNDFDTFLKLMCESGRSSFMYLQNVIPAGRKEHQEMAIALAMCERLLKGEGAYRVHGGGFAGTTQAFVRREYAEEYALLMDSVFGEGACMMLAVRPEGAVEIKL